MKIDECLMNKNIYYFMNRLMPEAIERKRIRLVNYAMQRAGVKVNDRRLSNRLNCEDRRKQIRVTL